MNDMEQSLYAANVKRYNEAKNPLRSHGPDHHLRVYQYALTLAKKLDVSFDREVLAAACLLHDMAAYYPDRTGDDYHDFDDKLAQEVLEGIAFPAGKIAAVTTAIAHHGSDAKYKMADESIETKLLRDADKLDVFGPIGVARVVMVRTLKGDTLDEIVADFYTGGHLKRKWDSISTDEARDMARLDYGYSTKFFRQLAASLAPQAGKVPAGENAAERATRILAMLAARYPERDSYDLDGRGLHFVCEVEPVDEHPEYDRAVEVIIFSKPHKHIKMTQHYTIMSGTLDLHVDSKHVHLTTGDTYDVLPGQVHWAKSPDEAVVEIYSTPGWSKEDHIVVEVAGVSLADELQSYGHRLIILGLTAVPQLGRANETQ